MSEYYIKSLLPDWVKLKGKEGEFELDISFQFQLEWERKFSKMWYKLTDSERESITPIEFPYTEESVAEFLELLKKTKENRSFLGSVASFLPDVTKDKVFPIKAIKEAVILEELENGTHPVLFSWMKEIPERNFSVGKYQVTQAIWENAMGNNPSYFKGSSRPVETVSWMDCVLFCNKLSEKEGLEKVYTLPNGLEQALKNQTIRTDDKIDGLSKEVSQNLDANGYRLPREEWEFAAKANQDFEYAGSNNVDEVAWYNGNSNSKTHGVGQKKANGFGLYDMSGNVWEWCWYTEGSDRVYRGGSWRDDAEHARVSDRIGNRPSYRSHDQGFRLFRTIR